MRKHNWTTRVGAGLLALANLTGTMASDSIQKWDQPSKPPAHKKHSIPSQQAKAPPPMYEKLGTIERLDPAADGLIPGGAQIEKLAEGFTWAEGPVWIRNGN